MIAAKSNKIQYPLYKAIRKYGEDNFTVEQIEEVDDELLNEREKYWIKFYDTYIKNKKGYNCTLGGEGNLLIDFSDVYDLWDKGYSIKQIAEITHHDRASVRKILKKNESYTIDESNRRGDNIQSQNRFKTIDQYTINGQYLNTFKNMQEAENITGISSKLIWLGVHSKQKVVKGYQWKFTNDDTNIIKDLSDKKIRTYNQPVVQINKTDNKIINIFKNASEASRKTNIHDTAIRKACKHKEYTAGGYKWEYWGGDDFNYEHQDYFS